MDHMHVHACPYLQEKSSEEPPLEVVPVTIDLEAKNTKRKFVFRLMTSNGQSYFLQVSHSHSYRA